MRVDETGRQYTDLGIGEHGQQLGNLGITMIGRKILLSGTLYFQNLTDTITVACSMGNNIISHLLLEPVTLVITKPIDLTKIPFEEPITITEFAVKQLNRLMDTIDITVTPSVLPSLLKILIETITVVPTAYKNITHRLTDIVYVVPSIFRTWLSTKTLTENPLITNTAYKHATHYLTQAISVIDYVTYGFYVFCNVAVSVACAMGNRSITHKLVESADMISEQMKALVRIVEDEVVYINATALKQPQKLLSDSIALNDYIIKPITKILNEVVSVVDAIKFGTSQYCSEAISVICSIGNRSIIKSAIETISIAHIKTISLIRTIIQNVIITPIAIPTKNIFLHLYETFVIHPFINGLFTGLARFTAKETVDKVFSKQTLADIKSATLLKVGHAGSSIDSMKKATITTLKTKTGIFKLGDEQK